MAKNRLRLYDENICRHTKVIGAKRGGIRWKYFQYLSLLFTEMYLDRYFSDRAAFCADLNAFLQEISAQASGRIRFAPYTPDKMNKLAFMCATGSGKTLLMHVNILQFLHYFRRAQRQNSRLSINKAIVLAPAEGWYTLLIPQKQLEIDSVQKLEAATDYAAPALKSCLDKFCRYEKERWEAPLLRYAPQHGAGRTGDELEAFFTENARILKERGGLDAFEKEALRGQLALLDFRQHLYAPLPCLDSACRNIQAAPVGLNEDERKFVTLLHAYTESHAAGLAGKSLYLLRVRPDDPDCDRKNPGLTRPQVRQCGKGGGIQTVTDIMGISKTSEKSNGMKSSR